MASNFREATALEFQPARSVGFSSAIPFSRAKRWQAMPEYGPLRPGLSARQHRGSHRDHRGLPRLRLFAAHRLAHSFPAGHRVGRIIGISGSDRVRRQKSPAARGRQRELILENRSHFRPWNRRLIFASAIFQPGRWTSSSRSWRSTFPIRTPGGCRAKDSSFCTRATARARQVIRLPAPRRQRLAARERQRVQGTISPPADAALVLAGKSVRGM